MFNALSQYFSGCCPCLFNRNEGYVELESQPIKEIVSRLKVIAHLNEVSNPKMIKQEKEQKKQALEDAYQIILEELGKTPAPDRILALYAGEVLFNYGRLCYEENFGWSKEIQLAALNLQLHGHGIAELGVNLLEFKTLEDLKEQTKASSLFPKIQESLLDLDYMDYMVKMEKASFPQEFAQERDFILATTLRWLGHCYQNISEFKSHTPLNNRRLENIYYFSEALLKNHPTLRKHRLELAELYYNSWHTLHFRNHPNDTKGAVETYDLVLELNPDPEMQARVANMRFCLWKGAGDKEKAEEQLLKAIEIRASIPETKQNGFLLANLRNNYAYNLLLQNPPNLDKAEEAIKLALKYSGECRANGEDHFYFANYDMNMAKIHQLRGQKVEAVAMMKEAFTTLAKYPESNQDLMEKALKLQAEIDQMS